MKKQLAICAALWLFGLGAAGTAAAQAVYAGPGYAGSYAGSGYAGSGLPDPVLPPYEIMSIVRSTGLAPLTRPMRRGPYYVLVAVDRVGRQMRVVVDAQLGDIVNMRPAMAAASYGPEVGRPNGLPGAATVPPGPVGPTAAYGSHPSGDALAPMPPRSIPNPNPPNAAPTSTAVPNPTSPTNPASPNVHANASGAPLPPTRLAVAEPALPPPPPLPRPRPKLALNDAAAAEAPAPPPAVKPFAPAAAPPSAAPSAADDASKQIE